MNECDTPLRRPFFRYYLQLSDNRNIDCSDFRSGARESESAFTRGSPILTFLRESPESFIPVADDRGDSSVVIRWLKSGVSSSGASGKFSMRGNFLLTLEPSFEALRGNSLDVLLESAHL